MSIPYDYAIIGAGIAGASLAASLSGNASVVMLEMEDTPGYHSTGRSAAFWSETYGGPAIAPLTVASGPWLDAHGLLEKTGNIFIGRQGDAPLRDAFIAEFKGRPIRLAAVDPRPLIDGLREDWPIGVSEPDSANIDVGGLHGLYLKQARSQGTTIMTRATLVKAAWRQGIWHIETAQGDVQARVLINAAGAWADDVARNCGIAPIGITPYRRTMVQARLKTPLARPLPHVMALDSSFYLKAEGSDRIWLSPHDETASPACDVAPEELDVAIAMARLEEAIDLPIAAIEHRWAGLRSFTPDRLPVYGPDPDCPSFFWFAGQGGFGIQTAPAAAALANALLTGNAPDASVANIDATVYSAERFTKMR